MIGTVNLKFFFREMLPETGSGIKEAGLKFPHEQHSERVYLLLK